MNKLIYGKNDLTNVVSIEVQDDNIEVFREIDGEITCEVVPYPGQFLLFPEKLSDKFITLKGDSHYQYGIRYKDMTELKKVKQKCYRKQRDFFTIAEPKENAMVQTGITYYNDMDYDQISVLSFDIEATTLMHNKDSKVLLISNTYRSQGKYKRKLFSYKDYDSQMDMIVAWCDWVRKIDPSIILGHNIYGYDLPYLAFCCGTLMPLRLGRDGSDVRFNNRPSKKRKDGSQEYEFHNAWIYGREIVDTFFLAINYCVGKDYPDLTLKGIIKHEGLEKKNRQHYPADQIGKNYTNPTEWEKIKVYAKDDADDALKLFDLMVPGYINYANYIPKPFQQINNSASGSQLNSFMIRAYLQDGYSLPKADPYKPYQGAISFGNPGIYKKVRKTDVGGMYPNVIKHFKIFDKLKDPKGYMLEALEFFIDERDKNKFLYKENKILKFLYLSNAQKIINNSWYGLQGTPGLLFNSLDNAELVTRKGREILETGLKWCKEKGYQVVNADTDSFSYVEPKGYTEQMYEADLKELNDLFPDLIIWEDDGYYKKVIVVKTKNYILDTGKKVIIKGSALKATMKEPALKQFIKDVIDCFLKDTQYLLYPLFNTYLKQINDIKNTKNIDQWASKKTITDAVLNGTDTTQVKIRNALKTKHVQEGDKVYMFFKQDESLSLLEHFDGDYSKPKLYEKLYKSIKIFDNLIPVKLFPNLGKVTINKKMEAFNENHN